MRSVSNIVSNDFSVFWNDFFGSLKVAKIDGEPWFNEKEVANMMKVTPSKDMIDEVDKVTLSSGEFAINKHGVDTIIKNAQCFEVGYFRKWIDTEILPFFRSNNEETEMLTYEDNVDYLVFNKNGIPVTTSRAIAKLVGKSNLEICCAIDEEINYLYNEPCDSLDLRIIINDFRKSYYLNEDYEKCSEYELGEMAAMWLIPGYFKEYWAKIIVSFEKMKMSIKANTAKNMPKKGKLVQVRKKSTRKSNKYRKDF